MSAMESAVLEHGSEAKQQHAVGKRAIRKAAWRLLPLLSIGYGVAYMDRVNISFASLQMNQDLHLSATVYGFGAGLFFVSYALCEIPSNLLLMRFGAKRWLARIMLTWGILAVAMMLVRTPMQFYVLRFLLGMAEAGFFPGVVYYLMQWFPPEMRARAVSRFYVSLPLSSVTMGLIAGGLMNLNGFCGLHGWQWLFLVEGIPSIVMSLVFYRCLPDTPSHATWLEEDERKWLLERIRQDAQEGSHATDVRSALLEKRVWLLGILFMLMLGCNYAYTFSAPAILKSLTGWNVTQVGFLVAAINILGAFSMIFGAIHSDRVRKLLEVSDSAPPKMRNFGCAGTVQSECAEFALNDSS